jgi:hypothetical protein
MSFSLKDFLKPHSFASRPPERQVLVVPVHGDINKEPRQSEVQSVLKKAAGQITESGLLWRWIRHDGASKLVRWDSEQLVFLQGTLSDWVTFFGTHWRVFDTNNQEFLGPSQIVADRMIEAVLLDPCLPVATWALQLSRKRAALTK